MYISNNGCMAFRTEGNELYLFMPDRVFQYFNKTQAKAKFYAVTDDEDAPEQECINYVMGHPGAFRGYKPLTASDKQCVLLEGEQHTIALFKNGNFYICPLDACNWVDVCQARELEALIKRKLGEFTLKPVAKTRLFDDKD